MKLDLTNLNEATIEALIALVEQIKEQGRKDDEWFAEQCRRNQEWFERESKKMLLE